MAASPYFDIFDSMTLLYSYEVMDYEGNWFERVFKLKPVKRTVNVYDMFS